MKNIILVIAMSLLAMSTQAQKWSELTDEQKIMKLKSFRTDNQKYLKTTLGMTQTQLDDIDNVNLCYLGTLDRINRYVKDEAKKDDYAEAVSRARWVQIDAIMGTAKHEQYIEYLKAKIEKTDK